MTTSPKSKILLIGSGGVGTMAAYALETGGLAEVTAVLRSNYSTVLQNGFSIDSIEHGRGIKNFRPTHILNKVPSISGEENSQPFDYIIVTTKNIPDIPPTVLDIITPAVTPGHTAIVLLQNGLNIEKPILAHFPANPVISGVSIISASEPTPGHIIHEFTDSAKFGPFPLPATADPQLLHQAEASARHFIELYNACGRVNASYDANVPLTRWRKLVYNASFNPVSAILGMGVITMRKSRHVIDELVLPAMREVVAVARAKGVLLPEGVEMEAIRIDPVEEDFLPSMGQDARKGNFIEMETIVGEPVREAERLGMEVPTLRVIYGVVKGLQRQTMERKGLWKAEFGDGNPYR